MRFLFVLRGRSYEHLLDFGGKSFRFNDLHKLASAEDVGLEIVCRSHQEFKVSVFGGTRDFFLALVDGQVAKIEAFVAECSQHDALRFCSVAGHDAETLFEKFLRVEVRVDFKSVTGEAHLKDPVEGEDGASAFMEMPQDIPALSEHFDAIRLQLEMRRFVGTIFPVINLDFDLLLHGVNDHLKMVVARNLLEQDSVLQRKAFAYYVVHCQSGKHPVLNGVFLQNFFIANEISVAVVAVAVDIDAENVFDGIFVPVEGGTRHVDTFAHFRREPLGVYLCKCHSFEPVNRVHEPDVFLEFCRDRHVFFFCKSIKKSSYIMSFYLFLQANKVVMKILVLNGPNLNLIGKREPEIYGTQSLDDFIWEMEKHFPEHEIFSFQSNHEGVLIDKLQEAMDVYDGVVINPGGYTHTSIALADTIRAIRIPVVEVHITNVFEREEYRRRSFTGDACVKIIAGHGLKGYEEAVEFLVKGERGV